MPKEEQTRRPHLLFVVTEDWVFWMHRLDLARAARDAGYAVSVATRVRDHGQRIEDEGFRLYPVQFRRGSLHPIRELATVMALIGLYRRVRPDLVHHVALKPVLYGSWAAGLVRIPAVVNAFVGLGHVFIATGWKARLLRIGVTCALRGALALPHAKVIVQNEDDRELLLRAGVAKKEDTVLIPGSGVDVARFAPSPEVEGRPVVILAARMLKEKGVGEFVDAARLLQAHGIQARCVLVGMVDRENPAHITDAELLAWQREGVIEWWGHREDMPRVLAQAHVVVLPSYREGFPRVLLEAAACGRPVVATDVPGCRDAVRPHDNGLLVPAKDSGALFQAIATLVQDRALRARMGRRGREIVAQEFSSALITKQVLNVYHALLDSARVAVRGVGT